MGDARSPNRPAFDGSDMMPALAGVLALATALSTQLPEGVQPTPAIPFGVGERFTYAVKLGPFKAGRGSMEVMSVDTIRGRNAWRAVFRVKGGILGYKADNTMETWMDTATMASLRFTQDFEQTGSDRKKHYEIFPDRAMYQESDKSEQPSISDPLDNASFIYFIRTVPLEIGCTYTFERYFRPDRNPVRIKVLRRETVKVPAGHIKRSSCSPMIKSKGIFSENSKAEIWFSEDASRIMVQLKADLPVGSLNLYLTSARPPTLLLPERDSFSVMGECRGGRLAAEEENVFSPTRSASQSPRSKGGCGGRRLLSRRPRPGCEPPSLTS